MRHFATHLSILQFRIQERKRRDNEIANHYDTGLFGAGDKKGVGIGNEQHIGQAFESDIRRQVSIQTVVFISFPYNIRF